jgi:hypothetical protein
MAPPWVIVEQATAMAQQSKTHDASFSHPLSIALPPRALHL